MKIRAARIGKALLAAVVLLLCMEALFGALAEEYTVYTAQITCKYGQTDARKMLDMVNGFRTGEDAWYWNYDNKTKIYCEDLEPLKYDYGLEKVAMQRAAEIAIYFDHMRPNLDDCFDAYDLSLNSYWSKGENIAAGYKSASDAYKGWREDKQKFDGQGHRRNMLGEDFNAIGIGHVYFNGYHYWVQEFGYTSNDSEPQTPANNSSTKVSVEIASPLIASISASAKALTMSYGDAVDLAPDPVKLCLWETWPGSMFSAAVSYEWTVEDPSIVSLEDGVLTAIHTGETKLTASVMGKNLTKKIQVKVKKLSGAEVELDLGADNTLFYDGTAQEPAVRSVVCGGRTLVPETDYSVTYAKNIVPGTAKLTISGRGNYSGSIVKKFTIKGFNPTSLALSESGPVELEAGDTLQLRALMEPEHAYSKLSWSSSNKKIAKVSANGLVQPVKEGSVVISVKSSKKGPNGKKLSASVAIQIVDHYKPTGVALDRADVVELNMKETLELHVRMEPADARSGLSWSSSNKKIATVNGSGLVTAKKAGLAKITVKTRNGLKASVQVRIVDPTKATSVALSPAGPVQLPLKQQLTLVATMQPSTATGKLTWTTSNKKIATVKSGVVTPKKKGSVTISVKTSTGKKASVRVEIVDAVEAPAPTLEEAPERTPQQDAPEGEAPEEAQEPTPEPDATEGDAPEETQEPTPEQVVFEEETPEEALEPEAEALEIDEANEESAAAE